MFCHYSIVLGLLASYIGFAFALDTSAGETVFQCAPATSKTCYLNLMFENPAERLRLHNVDDKKTLNIKGGSIVALKSKHCISAFSTFEKVTIGRVGLMELCILPSFVNVAAENNRITTLHVEQTVSDGSTYRLEVLRLNDNQLESVESMRPFVALKELHLERNALSTLDMACFEKMTQLKRLYLGSNRLNTITSTVNDLSLPGLNFLDLQNNTLTNVNLQSWSLPSLEELELRSNNLTNVHGLDQLEALADISLANNQWECYGLDQMLEWLKNSSVTIKDGDQNCTGIRDSSICCAHEETPTELTLLDELNRFSTLKQRYDELESKLNETVQKEVKQFEEKLKKLNETCQNTGTPDTKPEVTGDETSTDGPVAEAPAFECKCSEEKMSAVEIKLKELETKINENGELLKNLQKGQTQFSYMTVLAKHEFRVAVKRGDQKLKELSSMLAILRENVQEKKKQ